MFIVSHLRSFQALELALRTGSLKNAAEMLAITPAAVGQRIKTLEDYLGIDLIVRSRSGIFPTAALSRAMPHLERGFSELGAAAEALDFQRVNEIHIAALPDLADLWLRPRLELFKAAHPNFLFCVNGEGDVAMRLGRADVEISFGERREQENVSLLFHDFLVPISSPGITQRIGKLRKNKLEGFPLLHLDFYRNDPDAIDWPTWVAAHGHRTSATDRGLRFRRMTPGLDAVSSNAGPMICGLALIAERLEAGEFTLPFPMATGQWTGHAFHAQFRKDALLRPQLVRFRTWLEEEARQTAAKLASITAPAARDPDAAAHVLKKDRILPRGDSRRE
jgi:LysR family transcriptional regulator, glycine cleavage system transcriptional activator